MPQLIAYIAYAAYISFMGYFGHIANKILIVGLLVSTASFLIIGIYLCYIKNRQLLQLLKNSTEVTFVAGYHNSLNPRERITFLGTIIRVLHNPEPYLNNGKLNPQDLQNFPPHLKRTLLWFRVLTVVNVIHWAITIAVIKLPELLA